MAFHSTILFVEHSYINIGPIWKKLSMFVHKIIYKKQRNSITKVKVAIMDKNGDGTPLQPKTVTLVKPIYWILLIIV